MSPARILFDTQELINQLRADYLQTLDSTKIDVTGEPIKSIIEMELNNINLALSHILKNSDQKIQSEYTNLVLNKYGIESC